MSFDFNRKLAIGYLKKLLSEGKFELISDYVHENYTLSDSSVSIVVNNAKRFDGIDALRERLELMREAMPDQQFNILKIIAEENAVITWWSWEGTQTGPLYGFPPKGKRMKIFGTQYMEIKDGKIISSLVNFDTFNFLIQLGHASMQADQETLITEYLKNLEEIGSL